MTLSKIPDVKRLYVDSLIKVENIHYLKELTELQALSIGISELTETEILDFPNFKKIEYLAIGETKTKALNLEYLKDYKNLKSLIIDGHTKNIDAVGELSELESLSICSVKKVPLSFVNKLQKLKTLGFLLGGRENINEITENQIEHLEILRVQGFNDIGNIERFTRLKTLIIEDQIQLKNLVFDKKMDHLEYLRIFNCKALETVKGLLNLPNLEQVRISQTAIEFDEFIKQKLPALLKILGFSTAKTKLNTEIKDRIEKLGYESKIGT